MPRGGRALLSYERVLAAIPEQTHTLLTECLQLWSTIPHPCTLRSVRSFFFFCPIWSNAKRTRRVRHTNDTWVSDSTNSKCNFFAHFMDRRMKWCDCEVFISRILRTICETMSKRKSIFRRDSSVRLRQIHFFCDLSVRCHFSSPRTYSCGDGWKIERKKLLKTWEKNMINSDWIHIVHRESTRQKHRCTSASEIKIRINIQILNRYTTHSSEVPFAIFSPHISYKKCCRAFYIRLEQPCDAYGDGDSGAVAHNKI